MDLNIFLKDILTRLVQGGDSLQRAEVKKLMVHIATGELSSEQIAAVLTGLQMKGVTAEELLGFRDGLLETGVAVNLSPYRPVDIVGTGGDCKNTFNISTCACLVVAGAGYKVAKHGNYAASSVSGASSVMENHGVKFTNDPAILRRDIEETNFVYLHAQLFARGMKFVGPVRKSLGIPTSFNLIGPLINPCRPAFQLLGVANLSQMRLYNSVLQKINVEYCIANSSDGYDEISLTGPFKILTRHAERVLTPSDLGFKDINPKELYGGSTAAEAMKTFDAVLEGTSTEAQKNAVVTNAAFTIQLMEPDKTLQECISIAQESLDSGSALRVLKKYVQLNS